MRSDWVGLVALALHSSIVSGRKPPIWRRGRSVPLDLEEFHNNKAFGTKPGEAAFDALGGSYPIPDFVDTKNYKSSVTGIQFSFPGYTGPDASNDNIICDEQVITVPEGHFFSASILLSNDKELATVSKNVTFTYGDNSTSLYDLRTLAWFNLLTINRGEIIFPKRYTAHGINWNTSHIFERTAALDVGKQLKSITLPKTTNTTEGRMHIFAISLYEESAIGIQSVRPTQKWLEDDPKSQVVEVTINNAGSECVSGQGLTVNLEAHGLKTTKAGSIKRLCPGDQKIATVTVRQTSTFNHKGDGSVRVIVEQGREKQSKVFTGIKIGFREWTTDLDNLAEHEAPAWFGDQKFGIFIHWGPYSVPGWGNSSEFESYAEWFWWYSTNPLGDRSNFRGYRLDTFGEDWFYDDSFEQFTAERFDPKEWLALFDDAGAKYFVITTKHHDGFALWDTKQTSNRSAIHYGPRRDLLKELFDAAAAHFPHMKRGTYFSLPEWFNPDFGPYGFDQFNKTEVPGTVSWPGDLATNPYTGQKEPYTGRIPVSDFIQDLMVPQMNQLAYDYGTDIMWCDCGAANGTAEFAAEWFNAMRKQNRQVAINSRCGVPQVADFDTPEYQTFSSAQHHKWESSQGMDPYSYGYNRATPDAAYMNASTIVKNLVDMVSKNGNFLLDIGPRADGTIVAREAANLREAGSWIKRHDEAIFNTTYWFVQSEIVGIPEVRFTQTNDAFYVLFLEEPAVYDGFVSIPAAVPILEGDDVSLLGIKGGESLEYIISGEGRSKELSIKVSQDMLAQGVFSWVFKIQYVA